MDIKGDGDLDLFVGAEYGYASFFRNIGTRTAPAFQNEGPNPFGLVTTGRGGSLAFGDLDNDGDQDVLVGDHAGRIIFAENSGTPRDPKFSSPFNPFSLAGSERDAVPTFADIDGDGDLDAFIGQYDGNMLFFQNTGTIRHPTFAAPVANPFGLSTVGYGGSPALADIDGDGDLDAFVGDASGGIALFPNIGTKDAPAFGPPVSTPYGISVGGYSSSPAFADVEGDGDLDAFVGEGDGNTAFLENVGTANAAAFAPPSFNRFGLATVFDRSKPAFGDVDEDGDVDALIGNGSGDFYFFENTGTKSAPAFAQRLRNPFGLADIGGNSAPTFADVDGDADLDVLAGDESGNVVFFESTPFRSDLVECSQTPESSCATGFDRASLDVDERKTGKERLRLQLRDGPALGQSDFGNPIDTEGTAYAVCVYDQGGSLKTAIEVDRAGDVCGRKACWKPLGGSPPVGRGYRYKDGAASAGGVRSIELKGGVAGKSRIVVEAKNNAKKGQLSLETDIASGSSNFFSVRVSEVAFDSLSIV